MGSFDELGLNGAPAFLEMGAVRGFEGFDVQPLDSLFEALKLGLCLAFVTGLFYGALVFRAETLAQSLGAAELEHVNRDSADHNDRDQNDHEYCCRAHLMTSVEPWEFTTLSHEYLCAGRVSIRHYI